MIAAAAIILGAQSHAALSLNLDYAFSGTPPADTGQPWVGLLFQDHSDISTIPANTVQLTISTAGLTSSENMANLYLNTDPNLNLAKLSGSLVTPPSGYGGTFSFTANEDAYMADGDGKYDVLLGFGTGTGKSGIVGPATAVVDFKYTGSGTWNSDSFYYLSTHAGGAGPFYAVSHIQNTPGGNSGWVAAPEPNYTLAGGILLLPFAAGPLLRKSRLA